MSDARTIAIRVLARVAKDDAWASRTLDAEVSRAGLDRRDAGLAAEIVYGALRVLPKLDAVYGAHLKKRSKLDPVAQAALRAGTYQLLHLSRVPAHAAVDGSVGVVRRERGPRVAGFVNAVLRKVAAGRPVEPKPPRRVALPAWLDTKLREDLGGERAKAMLESRPLPPPLDLRVSGPTSRETIAAVLAEYAAEVTLPAVCERALRLRRAGDPRQLPGFEEGHFTVQELGSQLVGRMARAPRGARVVDACAGRGGKTLQLARQVGPEGHVTALELHEARLEQIPQALVREGLMLDPELHCVDLLVGTGGLGPDYDVVLVDAPCTGLGTFHRRPELLARLAPEDVARMADVQRRILDNAAALVRPGGHLVYAVCSPLAEELGAIAPCLERGFELDPHPDDVALTDDDGVARLGPWTPGCEGDLDAYQVARMRRVR